MEPMSKEESRKQIEKWQGIQERNPPTSKIWEAASKEIHKLATVLNDGVPPQDAKGRK